MTDAGSGGAGPSAPPAARLRRDLSHYALVSIAAALTTMALKGVAAGLTGSVGLLSDALESGVNLVAAVLAFVALRAAAKEPDDDYPYGREKAEYLSAGIEGTMILAAAGSIAITAVRRLIDPTPVEQLGVGLAVSVVAAAVNGAVAWVLLRAGRSHRSITLQADARHLLTDVWTSVGVLVGVGLVAVTGWEWLDPLVALGVAANIVVAGIVLIRRSVQGLLDASLPPDELAAVQRVLTGHANDSVRFHELRSRRSGRRGFVSFHLLVPGDMTVQASHDLAEALEAELRAVVADLVVVIHVEPLDDPRSFGDGL